MPALVRKGDMSNTDPCGAPPRPNNQGDPSVIVNGKEAHCVGHTWEKHACPGSPPHDATTTVGSPDTFAGGSAIARVGDAISCGSKCDTGSGDTFVN